MKYDADIHHRRSIRLRDYDYLQAGTYFVTICTNHRQSLLGDVVCGEIRLNDAGNMAQSVWNEIPDHYPGVHIDTNIIMPNHIHFIVTVGAGPRACPGFTDPDPIGYNQTQTGHPQGGAPTGINTANETGGLSLPDVVHRYKTMTTKRYVDGVKQNGWPPFPGKLWQRNYWEHIVRDEPELNRIRQYIRNNPAQWDQDTLNHHVDVVKESNTEYAREDWMV